MGYKNNKCQKCGSYNITPYDKRQIGEKSICNYVCEECGCEMNDIVYHLEDKGLHEQPWLKVEIGQGERYRCDMCGNLQEDGTTIYICPLMEGKGYSLMQFCEDCYQDSLKDDKQPLEVS